MVEPWLQAHLTRMGRWNNDGVSRSVAAGVCRRCRARVLRGLDDDVAALPLTLDGYEIDRLGEVLALLDGRRTVELVPIAGHRLVIQGRDQYRIAAGRQRGPIHTEHRCGVAPLPMTAGAPVAAFRERPVVATVPPF